MGDAGCVVTNDSVIAQKVRALANYGSIQKYHHLYQGVNSRLDELQAGFLRIKLKRIEKYTQERIRLANQYLNGIVNPKIILPKLSKDSTHVFHVFAIRCESRDDLQQYLLEHGIQTIIHYPISIAKQPAYSDSHLNDLPIAEKISQEELSLPLYYGMSDEEIHYVIDVLNEY